MEFSSVLVFVSLLGMMVDTGGAFVLNISLTLFSPSEEQVGICYGNSTAGLGDTSLRLEHRFQAEGDNEPWVVERRNIPLGLEFRIVADLTAAGEVEGTRCVEFRLIQEEHGGGSCNCWGVMVPQVNESISRLR